MNIARDSVAVLATLALLAILAGPSLAQDDDDLAGTIASLVEDLGAEDWEVRDRAAERLLELGAPAIGALRVAADSDDPEVAVRARRVLEQLEAAEFARTIGDQPFLLLFRAGPDEEDAERARRTEAKAAGGEYAPPAGRVWLPIVERMRERDGEDALIELGAAKDRWTIDAIGEFRPHIDGSGTSLGFEIEGAENRRRFREFTAAGVGRRLAIIVRGEVVTSPTIRAALEGSGVVTGLDREDIGYLRKVLNER